VKCGARFQLITPTFAAKADLDMTLSTLLDVGRLPKFKNSVTETGCGTLFKLNELAIRFRFQQQSIHTFATMTKLDSSMTLQTHCSTFGINSRWWNLVRFGSDHFNYLCSRHIRRGRICEISNWNRVTITCSSRIISTSGLVGVILTFCNQPTSASCRQCHIRVGPG